MNWSSVAQLSSFSQEIRKVPETSASVKVPDNMKQGHSSPSMDMQCMTHREGVPICQQNSGPELPGWHRAGAAHRRDLHPGSH